MTQIITFKCIKKNIYIFDFTGGGIDMIDHLTRPNWHKKDRKHRGLP